MVKLFLVLQPEAANVLLAIHLLSLQSVEVG